jgi:putative ABC transport system permease protein
VTPDYFKTFGIRITHGRGFSERDRTGTLPVAIVNEAFVRRYLTGIGPLTARVRLSNWQPSEWQIVGVHDDVRSWGLQRDQSPAVTLPFWQSQLPAVRLAVRTTGDPSALQAAIVTVMQSVDRDLVIDNVQTMEQVVSDTLVHDRFNTVLFGGFALAGLLLAALGVYGVMSYAVAQRTHEIGIRVALGADRLRIVRQILREGLGTAAAGTAVGIAGAFAAARMMQGIIWGVSGLPPAALVIVSSLLLLTALIACLVPARRAASVDPMVALRHE